MPLKLLAKKSWHVYNADNVARVRRDEAAAEAQEEEDERQRRERESDRRAALVRGETLPGGGEDVSEQQRWKDAASALADDSEKGDAQEPESVPRHARPPRRQRKRRGEDDTDFEMRLAKEQREKDDGHSRDGRGHHQHARRGGEPALVDSAGHIDLFGQAASANPANPANPANLASSRAVPQPGDAGGPSMRFADAAGRDGFGTWYTGQAPPKRSFALSRPERSERSETKDRPDYRPPRAPIPAPAGSIAADPLAAMKQATAALRALKKERQRESDEQGQAMAALMAEQRATEKHGNERRRQRHRHDDRDERRYRDNRDRDRDRDRNREHGRHHSNDRHDRDRHDRHRDDRHQSGRHNRDHDRGRDAHPSERRVDQDRHSSRRHRSRSPRSSHRSRSKSP